MVCRILPRRLRLHIHPLAQGTRRVLWGWLILALLLTACASDPASGSPSATPVSGSPTRAPARATASPTPLSPAATETFRSAESASSPVPGATPSPSPRPAQETPSPAPGSPTASPTAAGYVTRTPTPTPAWMGLPVVPTALSERALNIYRRGLEQGNRPDAFAKVGDCGVETRWFLYDFDQGPEEYALGEYEELQAVIDAFAGSFERESVAARNGATAASLFVPLWADQQRCEANESPLECEYRQMRPSIALIMLGTNDADPEKFEAGLRRIIALTEDQGILPVLATKADNREGGHRNNAIIAALAEEYQLPLWNFWAAVQTLPRKGLQEDGAHLTFLPNRFDDPLTLTAAWPVRNLTALQVLQALQAAAGKVGK